MIGIYAVSQTLGERSLVMGTTDKSEYWMGYVTKHGDHGVDIEPMQHVYKTQVRDMARVLGVNEEIINKPSSARLLKGQDAATELKMDYETIDYILTHYCDKMWPKNEMYEKLDVPKEHIDRVVYMIDSTGHKRRVPDSY
jgi:NAD+ synthase